MVQISSSNAPASAEARRQTLADLNDRHRAFSAAQAAEDWDGALIALGRLREALPDSAELMLAEAKLRLEHFNETDNALALIEKALPTTQCVADAHEILAEARLVKGDLQGASQAAQAALAANPALGSSYLTLIKTDAVASARLEPQLRAVLQSGGQPPMNTALLLNALGRLREKAKDFDAAWTCFEAAKRVAPNSGMDMDASETTVAEAKTVFTPDFMDARRSFGSDDERMVFVVGMPRSGTTLVERILAAHPDAAAAGELLKISTINRGLRNAVAERTKAPVGPYEHLQLLNESGAKAIADDYLIHAAHRAKAPAAKRIVDKMPANFAHLGLIAMLFPKARIIHLSRDPLDVFVSSFKEMFRAPQPQSHDQMTFAHYAMMHHELMDHWRSLLGERLLDIRYEDVVADLGSSARRIVAHVGLDWNDACGAPHETAGVVMTASAVQVREPVHQRSVQGWRRYERQLAPLRDVLQRYAALKAGGAAA